MTDVTRDSIALRGTGAVTIAQPKKGFRFTLDSLLLVDFCRIKPRDRILEPGAGTGVISLLLAKKFPKIRIVADEFEPHAFSLLCLNIEQNALQDRVVPIDRDINGLGRSIAPSAFDVIVANPPYTESGAGKKSPSLKRQFARQDESAPLPVWLDLGNLLKNKGRFFLVFPAVRLAELTSSLRERQLEPKRLRFIHPFRDKPASLVLLEAVKAAGTGLEVLQPLIVHGPGGEYTKELTEIYQSSA